MTSVPVGDRIVAALRSNSAALIAFFAPSGYGKTYRARAFGATFDTHVYRALTTSDDAATVLGEIRDALQSTTMESDALVTIDDAHVVDDAQLGNVIDGLLALPRPRLRVLICSRREPSFSLVRYADGAGLAVYRRTDLALGINDRNLASVNESAISSEELTRTLCISNGWPEVTLYFVRLAREGRLYEAMRSFTSPEWRDLLDWVEERVVGPLPENVRQALFLAAAITDARPEDFSEIGPDADVALFRDYQLADVGMADEIRLLPLLRHYCYARHPQQLREIASAFASRTQATSPLRAARAFVNVRQLRDADRLVERFEHLDVMALGEYGYPGTSLEVFAKAPPYLLFPRLWFGLVAARRAIVGSEVLADEGEELLESRVLDGRWQDRLRAITALLCFECGRPQRAREHLAQLRGTLGDEDRITVFVEMVDDFFAGRFISAVERWHLAAYSLVSVPAWYGWIGLFHARALGYLGEYGRFKRAIEMLISLGQSTPALSAEAAIDGAFFAWLMSEHELHIEYRSEAARLARYYDLPAYWSSVAALYGIAPGRIGSKSLSPIRVAMLIAHTLPPEEARALAETALARADRMQLLSLRVASRIVLAAIDAERAEELYEQASELATSSDSEFLVRSVEAARADDHGGLFDALRRASRPQALVVDHTVRHVSNEIVLDPADLSISRHGKPMHVSERVRELLFFLGTSRSPVRRDVLADHLWPDLDGDSAASALKMCVHRARAQTGAADAIVVSGGTYALGLGASCDYFEVLRIASGSYETPLDPALRARLSALFERLCGGGTAAYEPWPWMIPASRALRDAAISIGERLFADARARNDVQQALFIARQMAHVRPEMELARAMIVQLHLDMGNTTLAREEYEDYRTYCKERFASEPSESLRRLLTG